MKKLFAILMALVMVLSLMTVSAETATDKQYVLDKGTLVVGITDFAPMDYKDADGNWIGFDADVAKLFAEYLGVKVEFVEIDWDNKILELDAKAVDCIWNGMTLTDAVKVVVVPADQADKYQTVESLAALTFAVEAGSAGEAVITDLGLNCTPVTAQADALMEVAAFTSDAAVIDALMAAAMIGEGTNYANLTYTIGLNSEEYGVGFRKGSDLAAELNGFLVKLYAVFKEPATAETYKVQAALIAQE